MLNGSFAIDKVVIEYKISEINIDDSRRATAPYVMRPQTKAEEKTIEQLQRMIPDWE